MVLELGGRRQRRPRGRARRGRQPDQLVRQRRLGPGRLGRRRLPAARPARAVARPTRSGRRSGRSSPRSSSRSSGSSSRSSRVVTIRRALWPADAAAGSTADAGSRRPRPRWIDRLRAWERRTDHPSGSSRPACRAGRDRPAVPAVRAVGHRVQPTGRRSSRRACSSRSASTAGGYPYLTRQRLQPVGARAVGDTGQQPGQLGPVGLRLAPWHRAPTGCGVRASRRSAAIPAVSSGRRCSWPRSSSCLLARRPAARPAHDPRRPDGARPRLLRRADPRPRALRLPVLRAGVDPRRGLAGAGGSPTSSCRWPSSSTCTRPDRPFYPDNPAISDWLGIGPALRVEPASRSSRSPTAPCFLWAFVQLARRRPGTPARRAGRWNASSPADEASRTSRATEPDAVARPARPAAACRDRAEPRRAVRLAPRSRPPRPQARRARPRRRPRPPSPPMPTWTPAADRSTRLGVVGWFRARFDDAAAPPGSQRHAPPRARRPPRPARPVVLIVVLVVGTMLLRMFRLAEPYQMHFDEVYHARTATEFLQDWRYGIVARHLRVDPSAPGQVRDGRRARRCGATTRSAPRATSASRSWRRSSSRDGVDELAPGGRAGERLHVATGTRSGPTTSRRATSSRPSPAAGASALAIDRDRQPARHRLRRRADRDARPRPRSASRRRRRRPRADRARRRVDHPGRPPARRPTTAATLAAAVGRPADDRRPATAERSSSSIDLAGIADLAPGGSGSALDRDRRRGRRPGRRRREPRRAPRRRRRRLRGAPDRPHRRTDGRPRAARAAATPGPRVDEAIADGTLPGSPIEDVPRIAVATADGVTFVDPRRAARRDRRSTLDGGAHGLAARHRPRRPEALRDRRRRRATPSYVGHRRRRRRAPRTGRSTRAAHPAARPGHPGRLRRRRARWSTSSGRRPDRRPPTATHGRSTSSSRTATRSSPTPACRGSARSPGPPTSNPDYPSDDRQQTPRVRRRRAPRPTIDIGTHAFAWRLPGVIAGALTAGLLFLLARILFRRRLVAVLVGLFVLADGMFFVQSRIGMNDVYVGLFIVAAYTLFAAIWTGWWRGRARVLAGDAGRSACCSGSPSRASGSRPTRSARWCC